MLSCNMVPRNCTSMLQNKLLFPHSVDLKVMDDPESVHSQTLSYVLLIGWVGCSFGLLLPPSVVCIPAPCVSAADTQHKQCFPKYFSLHFQQCRPGMRQWERYMFYRRLWGRPLSDIPAFLKMAWHNGTGNNACFCSMFKDDMTPFDGAVWWALISQMFSVKFALMEASVWNLVFECASRQMSLRTLTLVGVSMVLDWRRQRMSRFPCPLQKLVGDEGPFCSEENWK